MQGYLTQLVFKWYYMTFILSAWPMWPLLAHFASVSAATLQEEQAFQNNGASLPQPSDKGTHFEPLWLAVICFDVGSECFLKSP